MQRNTYYILLGYLNGFPKEAGEPPYQLKGVEVVRDTGAGQEVAVEIALNDRSFSVWDTGRHAWRVAEGEFEVWVGGSSRDSSDASKAPSGKITV